MGAVLFQETIPFTGDNATNSPEQKIWSIQDNTAVKARFEKYLNSPAKNFPEFNAHQALLRKIDRLLRPGHTKENRDEAFALLTKASAFPCDANLCDVIANEVNMAILSGRETQGFIKQQQALEDELKKLEWNMQIQAASSKRSVAGPKELHPIFQQTSQMRMEELRNLLRVQPLRIKVFGVRAKAAFQMLILHLFYQRQFQHVSIALRFYRSVFNDGKNQLHANAQVSNFLAGATGLTPSLITLETFTAEIMADVSEGMDSVRYLLDHDQLESASKRLAELFVVGEHLPELQSLPIKDKRRISLYHKTSDELTSALEIKDYERADNLLNQLQTLATDLDCTKYRAKIDTAKFLASLQLLRIRNAFLLGDASSMEMELNRGLDIWPMNSSLLNLAHDIFAQSYEEKQTLANLDRLIDQQSNLQIYASKNLFLVATARDPERQKHLLKIFNRVAQIQKTLSEAQEMEKMGKYFQAWEHIELSRRQFPDDIELNQLHSRLVLHIADFATTLTKAEAFEDNSDLSSSLAWYLKAQKIYPFSKIARRGIDRITKTLRFDSKWQ